MHEHERPQPEARGVVHDPRQDQPTAPTPPLAVQSDAAVLPPGTTLADALRELVKILPGLKAALEHKPPVERPTSCQTAGLEALKHEASPRLDGTMKLESRRSFLARLAGPAVRVSLKYNRRILMGNIVIDATIIWDLDDEPDGNVQHIAEHGVTVDEVEDVLHDSRSRVGRSRRSGRPQVFGWTSTGKFITVIWEEVSDDPRMIYPVTAYEVPPPQGRQK